MAAREGVEGVTGVLSGEALVAGVPASDSTAVLSTSSGHQPSPSHAGAISPPQGGKERKHEEEPPDAKRTLSGFRCLVCDVLVTRNAWNQHAAGKKHQRKLAQGRSRGRESNNLEVNSSSESEDWDPCPPGMSRDDFDQLEDLRATPIALVDPKDTIKLGYARWIVQMAQLEVVDWEGIETSAALELQQMVLASLKELLPNNAQLHSLVSASLTKLTAGVALAHVSRSFVVGQEDIRGMPMWVPFQRGSSLEGDRSTAYVAHAPHIVALAHLAPQAAKFHATTLSIRPEQDQGRGQAVCYLAAFRLLFSELPKLPFPPRHLIVEFSGGKDISGLASKLLWRLITQSELHTLLDSITVYTRMLDQDGFLQKWSETAARDMRTVMLLGVCRSKTSPLRILSPASVQPILEHIRPCSLTIIVAEKPEDESQEELENEEEWETDEEWESSDG